MITLNVLWGRPSTPEQIEADLELEIRRKRPDWSDEEVARAVEAGGYNSYLMEHGKGE